MKSKYFVVLGAPRSWYILTEWKEYTEKYKLESMGGNTTEDLLYFIKLTGIKPYLFNNTEEAEECGNLIRMHELTDAFQKSILWKRKSKTMPAGIAKIIKQYHTNEINLTNFNVFVIKDYLPLIGGL